MTVYGYKLFRLRKDKTLGSLFINKQAVIPFHTWLKAEAHPTKGYAVRPGWHACEKPEAPHLSKKGRIWCAVALEGVTEVKRPKAQGGVWYLAKRMMVLAPHNT